jgi:hypothetical protein
MEGILTSSYDNLTISFRFWATSTSISKIKNLRVPSQ